MENVDRRSQVENPTPPEAEVQARLEQVFNRACRLIEQGEFLFPEEAIIGQYSGKPLRPKPNPSFGFFYENKSYILINGRRYKDLPGTTELTGDEIRHINFAVHLDALERMRLYLMRAPRFSKFCRLVVKKMDDGTFEGIIQEDDMGKILNNEKTNDVNFANIPLAAAKLILDKRIAPLGRSPMGAKASPSGEMRMFNTKPPVG